MIYFRCGLHYKASDVPDVLDFCHSCTWLSPIAVAELDCIISVLIFIFKVCCTLYLQSHFSG